MTTPSQIAEKLSEAERHALINGQCGVPPGYPEFNSDCICSSGKGARLIELGLAERRERWPNGIVRTPLGLSVRSLLIGEKDNG